MSKELCEIWNPEEARAALAAGKDPNFTNEFNSSTILLNAARAGHLDLVNHLLQRPDVNVNHADRNNWTALHKACFMGHTAIVRAILACPRFTCHNNVAMHNGNMSALYMAVMNRYWAIVRDMVKAENVHLDFDELERRTKYTLKSSNTEEKADFELDQFVVLKQNKSERILKILAEAKENKAVKNITHADKDGESSGEEIVGPKLGARPGSYLGPFNAPLGNTIIGKDFKFYTTVTHKTKCKDETRTKKESSEHISTICGPISDRKSSFIRYPCTENGCTIKCKCELCSISPCSLECRNVRRCQNCKTQCDKHNITLYRTFSKNRDMSTEVIGNDDVSDWTSFQERRKMKDCVESLEIYPGIVDTCPECAENVRDHENNHHVIHMSCKFCRSIAKRLAKPVTIEEMEIESKVIFDYESTLCEFCFYKCKTKYNRQRHEEKCKKKTAASTSSTDSSSNSDSSSRSDSTSNNASESTPESESQTESEADLFESDDASDTEIYMCDVCNKQCSSEQNYINHTKIHRERFHCPECQSTFTRSDNLTDHLRHVHKRTVDKIDYEYAQVSQQTTYNCEYCDYETERRKHYREHKKLIHKKSEQEKLHCNQCTYTTLRQGDLNQHIQLIHNTSEQEKLHCDECTYTTLRQGHLNQHIQLIHKTSEQKKLHCDQCTYTTLRQGHLNQHIQTVHSTDQEMKCTQCSFKTTRKSDFNSHIKTVHSIGKFKCHSCDFSNNEKKRLTQHIKRKHQNQEFNCDECEFKSILEDELYFHYNTMHKKRAKFQCEQCNYSTDEHDKIREHINNEH